VDSAAWSHADALVCRDQCMTGPERLYTVNSRASN
jgi:hypothetical protein